MRWYKSPTEESESPEMGDLMDEFGLRGYYFWKRNLDVMGMHLDIWNPGCNRFNKEWYLLQFHPWIKDSRTIVKILNFFQARNRIYYYFDDKDIILYFPELEERADKHTKQCLLNPEKEGKKRPSNAGVMHTSCRLYAQKIAQRGYLDAEKKIENKENESNKLGSNLEGQLGSSSNSSSKGTNNKVDTTKEDRKREDKGERDSDHERFLNQLPKD